MNITVKGRHMQVAPAIRTYAEQKIGRVGTLIDSSVTEVEIELWHERNPSIQNNQVVEVTIFTKGPVIRAREASTDMHAAIDLVTDKLERRIKRFRGRVIDKHTAGPSALRTAGQLGSEEEIGPRIVKTKVTAVKPMTTEEAILQMELLGHDFFVFTSAETEDINVLYRRRDGDYGIISPQAG